MKYTVEGFNQEHAVHLGLNARDLVFLRWLVDFYVSDGMDTVLIEDEKYFWVSYDYVIQQLPVMEIKSRSGLSKFLSRLKSVLNFKMVTTPKGNRAYYSFKGDVIKMLTSSQKTQPQTQTGGWVSPKRVGGCRPNGFVQYDSSINDSSINDSKKAQPSAELKAAFKDVIKEGFNIYALIGRFYKETKLNSRLPDCVLIRICDSYKRNKTAVKRQWPWFIGALKSEASKFYAQQSIKESEIFKTEPAKVLDIIAQLAAKMKV